MSILGLSVRQAFTFVSTCVVCVLVFQQVTRWHDLAHYSQPGHADIYAIPGVVALPAASMRDAFMRTAGYQEDSGVKTEEPQDTEEESPEGEADKGEHNDDDTDTPLDNEGRDELLENSPVMKPNYDAESPLCVALAADLDHFEHVIVVINSTLSHSSKPHLLQFRIITMSVDRKPFMDKFRERLPALVNLECIAFDPFLQRVSRLVGGKSSGRQELFNELNFAAFYMHELIPDMARVLYVDTDVVVVSDVQAELSEWSMQGRPVGGARDCSQRVGKYIYFHKLEELNIGDRLPLPLQARREDCVVNRGVVLVESKIWAERNMTGMIETLVQIHLSEDGPLWHSGVSQPPFLLAIAGRYANMGWQYNVRGLGRTDSSVGEVRHYKFNYLWSKYLDKFLFVCKFGQRRNWAFAPTIVPRAHFAKVLHFNGRLKPGYRERRSDAPVPLPPRDMPDDARRLFEFRPLCSCGEMCVQECAGIWWRYNDAYGPNAFAEDLSGGAGGD